MGELQRLVAESARAAQEQHCGNRNYIHERHDWLELTGPSLVAIRHCPGTRPGGPR